MESNSRFQQWSSSASDWLNEQEWFRQLKAKWEEVDPQSRTYIKAAGAGGAVLIVFGMLFSAIWNVHSLKSDLADKQQLLTLIQNANEELRRLRDETAGSPAANGGGGGPWAPYFETVGANAGVDKAALTISPEKPGANSDQAKETLYDLSLKHVSIKQIVRYAFGLENGSRPVKLRNLSIDTHADPEGYMDATLSVSGFALVTK
jgi:hypothetical protein